MVVSCLFLTIFTFLAATLVSRRDNCWGSLYFLTNKRDERLCEILSRREALPGAVELKAVPQNALRALPTRLHRLSSGSLEQLSCAIKDTIPALLHHLLA